MSFGIEKEIKVNDHVMSAGPLRRGMVYELERVFDGFFCSISVTYDGAVLL